MSTLVAYLLWTAKSELKPFTYFIQATEVDDTELWNNKTALEACTESLQFVSRSTIVLNIQLKKGVWQTEVVASFAL